MSDDGIDGLPEEGFTLDVPRPGTGEKIVLLTGAGVSAESGLPTFRGPDGLWEGYRVEEVATPEAWVRDPALVRRFYNLRRRAIANAAPNPAHRAVARIQRDLGARLVTQNVDDLHERAGSPHVLHLHGLLTEARCECGPASISAIGYRDLTEEDRCTRGHFLRPNVVWFGEPVPLYAKACEWAAEADWMIVVGTSLTVYPAAALVHEAPSGCRIVLIDPFPSPSIAAQRGRIWVLPAAASVGLSALVRHWHLK
ncbi:MAG: NAD-dependent deacylase [Opitutales bacterium]|nr:NAD-dependent deacylase [Opitutales bacterium]